MLESELLVGARFRWTGGHHPGELAEIVALNQTQGVRVRGMSGGIAGNVTWVPRTHLMAQAELTHGSIRRFNKLHGKVTVTRPQIEYYTPEPPKELTIVPMRPKMSIKESTDLLAARGINATILGEAIAQRGQKEVASLLDMSDSAFSTLVEFWNLGPYGKGYQPSHKPLPVHIAGLFTPLRERNSTAPTPRPQPTSPGSQYNTHPVQALFEQARRDHAYLRAQEDQIRAQLADNINQQQVLTKVIESIRAGLPKELAERIAQEA